MVIDFVKKGTQRCTEVRVPNIPNNENMPKKKYQLPKNSGNNVMQSNF